MVCFQAGGEIQAQVGVSSKMAASYGNLYWQRGELAEDRPRNIHRGATTTLRLGWMPNDTRTHTCECILKSATDEEQREMTPERVALYQQLVGSIMYASTHTRPDISFVAAHLGKFMHCPGPRHLDAARQVFRYLAGTRSYGPKYTTL